MFTEPYCCANLCQLLRESVAKHPKKDAVTMDDSAISYGELGRRANAVAQAIAATGPTDRRIAILSANSIDYIVLYWGVLLARGVTVELNPGLGDRELRRQIDSSNPAMIVAEQSQAGRLVRIGFSISNDASRVVVADVQPQNDLAAKLSSALNGEALPETSIEKHFHGGDLASIVHTSGTTGAVKGVCLTHGNMTWTVHAIAQSFAWERGLTSARIAGNLPLFYTYGKSQLHLATYLGAPIVVTHRVLTPSVLMGWLAENRITTLPLVPHICTLLLKQPEFVSKNLPNLTLITVAGGKLPASLALEMDRRFPGKVSLMYGLTEASTRVSCLPPGETTIHPNSCGKPLTGVELQIAGSTSPGQQSRGEILVRGPNVMRGYDNDPESTGGTLVDGWLRTGDEGYLDHNGYLFISGRLKETIKIMGESVSALGVETAIGVLPGVREVAVKGVPHPIAAEAIAAFVVMDPGCELGVDEVRKHCAEELGRARVPTHVVFREELPKTPSGKVRKHLLTVE